MFGRLNELLLRFTEYSEQYWFGDCEYVVLRRFRKIFAIVLFIFFGRIFPLLHEGLTSAGLHISSDLISFHHPISFPLLANEYFLPFFFLFMFSFAALYFFPDKRWPAVLATCMLFYVYDADYISTYAAHKILFISLVVLSLAPYPSPGSTTIPAWPIRILQITLISTYLGNGLGKFFFGDWLDHPDLLWTVVGGKFFGPVTAVVLPYIPRTFWTISEYFALAFELWLPWGLIIPKTRKITLCCGLAFHAGIAILLQGLWPFTLTILNLYLVFLPASKQVAVVGEKSHLPSSSLEF